MFDFSKSKTCAYFATTQNTTSAKHDTAGSEGCTSFLMAGSRGQGGQPRSTACVVCSTIDRSIAPSTGQVSYRSTMYVWTVTCRGRRSRWNALGKTAVSQCTFCLGTTAPVVLVQCTCAEPTGADHTMNGTVAQCTKLTLLHHIMPP